MLQLVVAASTAVHYTWHSFRHGLATRLRKAKCPADIIMQLCRWQTIESLRTYARCDAELQRTWHEKALEVTFEEGPGEQAMDSGPSLGQLCEDETWDRDVGPQGPRTPRRGAQTPAPRAARGVTVGDVALVPSHRYPAEICQENRGRGWEVKVIAVDGDTATVRYLNARAPDGRQYEDTEEPLNSLVKTS